MKIDWKDIKTIPYNEQVLLLVQKKGFSPFITQGNLIDEAGRLGSHHESKEWWEEHGYSDEYKDYAGRLIKKVGSKSKTEIIGWIELPL